MILDPIEPSLPPHPEQQGSVYEVQTSEANREATLAIVARARDEILVVSRYLDPVIYDRADFCETLKNRILERRKLRVRIVIQKPRTVVGRGHRLVALGQRLSSFIEVRKPGTSHRHLSANYLVVDGVASIVRTLPDRYEATVNFNHRRVANDLVADFEEIWEAGSPDPNLRRMRI